MVLLLNLVCSENLAVNLRKKTFANLKYFRKIIIRASLAFNEAICTLGKRWVLEVTKNTM